MRFLNKRWMQQLFLYVFEQLEVSFNLFYFETAKNIIYNTINEKVDQKQNVESFLKKQLSVFS